MLSEDTMLRGGDAAGLSALLSFKVSEFWLAETHPSLRVVLLP